MTFKPLTTLVTAFTSVKQIAITVTLVSAALYASAPASAQSSTVVHKFEAALLETDTGVNEVYKGIVAKAKSSCRQSSILYTSTAKQTCVNDIVDQLVMGVGNEALTQLHLTKIA